MIFDFELKNYLYISGLVKVSTGVLQLEKLSAGDALNHKLKYKR